MYGFFAKRTMADEIRQRKLMHIQAVYTNPNYDDGEIDKSKVVQDLEVHYDNVIEFIYTGKMPDSEEEVDLDSIPLFSGMKLPAEIQMPSDPEVVKFTRLKDLMDEPMQEM